jgi:hypothetical protein
MILLQSKRKILNGNKCINKPCCFVMLPKVAVRISKINQNQNLCPFFNANTVFKNK